MASTASSRIEALDGIRGYAAVAVAVMHFQGFFLGSQFLDFAYIAVDVFYVLSGYVISLTYQERIRAGFSFNAFVTARLARLYPLYLMSTSVGWFHAFALSIFKRGADSGGAIQWAFEPWVVFGNLLFLPNVKVSPNGELFPFNPPAWSIMAEVIVNLCFFLWLRGGFRRATIVIILSGLLLGAAILHRGNVNAGWGGDQEWFGVLRAVFGFSVGVMLYNLPRSSLVLLRWIPVELVGLTLMLGGMLIGNVLYQDLFSVFIVVPLLVGTSLVRGGPLLQNPVAKWLGTISYSVYLWQAPFSLWFESIARQVFRINPVEYRPLSGVVWLVGLLVLSWVSFRFIESPARSFIRRRFGKVAAA